MHSIHSFIPFYQLNSSETHPTELSLPARNLLSTALLANFYCYLRAVPTYSHWRLANPDTWIWSRSITRGAPSPGKPKPGAKWRLNHPHPLFPLIRIGTPTYRRTGKKSYFEPATCTNLSPGVEPYDTGAAASESAASHHGHSHPHGPRLCAGPPNLAPSPAPLSIGGLGLPSLSAAVATVLFGFPGARSLNQTQHR